MRVKRKTWIKQDLETMASAVPECEFYPSPLYFKDIGRKEIAVVIASFDTMTSDSWASAVYTMCVGLRIRAETYEIQTCPVGKENAYAEEWFIAHGIQRPYPRAISWLTYTTPLKESHYQVTVGDKPH